jgi:RNA-binding protein
VKFQPAGGYTIAAMIQKHIPARRSRTSVGRSASPPARSSGSALYRPKRAKRVRAGGTPPKPRKRRTSEAAAKAAAPLVAPVLNERQRRHLRGLAHELKPIIRLGKASLTESVAVETARALHDHELIKVKAQGADREARDALFDDLAQRTASALIHRIGNVAVLYRPNTQLPKILLPDNT